MAKRWSGRVSCDVVYRDENYYDIKIKCIDVLPRYISTIDPPAVGFGTGIAYDSPEVYDQVARAAFGFAANEYPELESELLFIDGVIEVTRK